MKTSQLSMFLRILRKSMMNRKSRMMVAFSAIIISSTVVSSMYSLTADINSKMNKELRVYGANMVISPLNTSSDNEITSSDSLGVKNKIPTTSLIGFMPYLYAVGKIGDTICAVSGTDFSEIPKVTPFWAIDGNKVSDSLLPTAPDSALIGNTLASKEKIKRNDKVSVSIQTNSGQIVKEFQIAGILSTGGSEDNQIFIPLSTLQSTIQKLDRISLIQVSIVGNREYIDNISQSINQSFPTIHASPILKIAKAEGNILQKIHFFMILVTITILLISALTVMTTMTALIVERRSEIALVKAIGAADSDVFRLFICELLVLGLLGGAVGYLLGYGVAQILGNTLFHTFINLRLIVIPVTILISCMVSLLSGLWAVRRTLSIEPAIVLRGE